MSSAPNPEPGPDSSPPPDGNSALATTPATAPTPVTTTGPAIPPPAVALLRDIIGSLPDCVLLLDRELRVVLANRWPGRSSAPELEGVHIGALLPPRVHGVALQAIGRVLNTGRPDRYAAVLDGSDGRERYFDITVSTVPGAGQVAALTLHATEITERLRDVTERQELERAILQAVNREQYRIGNDLHDGLGQELTGIALMLRGLAGRLASEYPPILTEIEGITQLVNNAIESTRALARGLSPVNLERGGLCDALEGLAMHASELYGVTVAFTHRVRSPRPLGAELANHLYRIAQEAVRNAVQHGEARTIRLHLSSLRGNVRLAVTDDGVGMRPQALDAPGMGLKIMRYRARILGGQVRFEPGGEGGTRVVCECPLAPAAPRRAASSGKMTALRTVS